MMDMRVECRDWPENGRRKGAWRECRDIPFVFGFGYIRVPDRSDLFGKALRDYADNPGIRRQFKEGIDRVYEVRVLEGRRQMALFRATLGEILEEGHQAIAGKQPTDGKAGAVPADQNSRNDRRTEGEAQ